MGGPESGDNPEINFEQSNMTGTTTQASEACEPEHSVDWRGKYGATTILLTLYSVIFLLLRAVPWKPEKYVLSFDISWDLALHYLSTHGARFGESLIFTFGPLGFAYARTFFPETYQATLLIWSIFSVVYGLALFKLSQLAFSSTWIRIAWLTCSIVLVSFFSDSFFFACPMLILCDYFLFESDQMRTSKISIALALALGISAAIKFTFLISAAVALTFITLDEVIAKRRLPVLALIAGGVFLMIWCGCGQSFTSLIDFIRYSLEVTRGYSDALALGTDYGQICLTALLAGLGFSFLGWATYRQLRWRSLGFIIAMAGVLFAMFKAAYVRHDPGHGTIAAVGFSFFSLLLFACIYHMHRSTKLQKVSSALVAGAFTFVVLPLNFAAPFYAFPLLCVSAYLKAGKNLTLVCQDLTSNQANRDELEKQLADIRAATPLPTLTGGVDAYPIDAKLIVANHFEYLPRPLLQSYQSYTAALLNADCRHLQSSTAPRWLLLSGYPWEDNWLPALNDGPSFPLILSHYKEDSLCSGQVLMQRRTRPLITSLKLLREFSAAIGETIDLSAYKEKFVWAQISPELSASGELARFVYHVLPLSITVEVLSGAKKFVAPRTLLSEGFLLSPFFDNSEKLSRVLKFNDPAVWKDLGVLKVTFADRNPAWWKAFRPTLHVKLFELTIDSKDGEPVQRRN
jgi:hypothetical protein